MYKLLYIYRTYENTVVQAPQPPNFGGRKVRFPPEQGGLEKRLRKSWALMQDLEDLLGRKVDVVTVNGLRKYFRDRILREAVPLWQMTGFI